MKEKIKAEVKYKPKELSAILGVSQDSIYRALKYGDLCGYKLGQWVIIGRDVHIWIDKTSNS